MSNPSPAPSSTGDGLQPGALATASRYFVPALTAAAVFVLVLTWMAPFAPDFAHESGLDTSYRLVFHHTFVHGFRLGEDIVGTYGPWGFAVDNCYYPETYPWVMAFRCAVTLGLVAGAWRLSRNLSIHPLLAAMWVPMTLVWGSLFFLDGMLSAMCCLPALLRRTTASGRDSWVSWLVVSMLALAGLSKFTYLVACGGCVALLSVEDLLRRRWPGLAACFAVSVVAFWVLGRQSLETLPSFLANSWSMASGYSEAMGHPAVKSLVIPLYIAMATLVSLTMLVHAWRHDRIGALVLVGTVCFVLLLSFKGGFVRHDAHEAGATTCLMTLTVLVLPVLWAGRRATAAGRANHRAGAWGLLLVVAAACCLHQTYCQFFPDRRIPSDVRDQVRAAIPRLANGWRWLTNGSAQLEAGFAGGMAQVREVTPLPMLPGRVDMYGLNQLAILATGMDYAPRPVAPGYHAWNDRLLAMNQRSLAGERRPNAAFFTFDPIDNRFPAMDDGLLLPTLLTDYDITGLAAGRFAVLQKCAVPRVSVLKPLSTVTSRLDQPIVVPAVERGGVWVRIDVAATVAGRLRTALFRPPEVVVKLSCPGQPAIEHRIIPAMAAAGFLLSPYMEHVGDFVALATHAKLPRVESFSVHINETDSPELWYQPTVKVSFQAFEFPPQVVPENVSLDAVRNFAAMKRTNTDNFTHLSTYQTPDGKVALFAHAPTHMELEVPPGATEVHFGYGIKDGAWSESRGVRFRVLSIDAKGAAEERWSAELKPKARPQDRGAFEVAVPLGGAGAAKVRFETLPVVDVAYAWSYWQEVHFR